MARAGGFPVQAPILCLPPATGDLPETGGVIVSSLATPTPRLIEHAGHCYQQKVIRSYSLNFEEEEALSEEVAKHPTKNAESVLRAHSGDAAKTLASKMAVGSDDLYELLELGEKRWHATADDIKKSFRRISLIYHPDKISHHGDEARDNAETHFKAVMKAYDILSDKKKRAAYDSIDDVDDSIPSEKDATATPQRFYEKFGACFAMNARWSTSDRVPELGDDSASMDSVERFYSFWYSFKSWRDFSFDLEYNTDQAESREEKRWMDRQNAKSIKVKKLEENSRIRRLVDLAYKHDPRLVRAKRAVKAKKDAHKQERQRKAEEANRVEREKEENERIVAEQKAAEDKVKRAVARKQKDAARQIVRKARQKLRATGRDLGIMESERGLVAIESMCAEGSAESIEAVTAVLSSMSDSDAPKADRAYAILDLALKTPVKPLNGAAAEEVTKKMSKPDVTTDPASVLEDPEPMSTPDSPNGVAADSGASAAFKMTSEVPKKAEVPWTAEELSLLSKGVAKFPGGTRDRWNRLAEYIGTKDAEEVLRKVSGSRPSKIKPGSRKPAPLEDSEPDAFVRFQEKKKGKPVVPQDAPSKPVPATSMTAHTQPPNKLGFTPKQQSLFEDALKKYPKGLDSRWKKVGDAVGRTPQHCQERFTELITFYSQRRAA